MHRKRGASCRRPPPPAHNAAATHLLDVAVCERQQLDLVVVVDQVCTLGTQPGPAARHTAQRARVSSLRHAVPARGTFGAHSLRLLPHL